MPENNAITPQHLCGYAVDAALDDAGNTVRCIRPGGRPLVLKKLDPTCVFPTGLHPSVHERLARVREIAHAGLANLHGVEREDETTWLVWDFVEGRNFDASLEQVQLTPELLARLAREIAFVAEALHERGVIHGAISAGNVIVQPTGAVKLTDVSPLLYEDPSADVIGIVELIRDAAAHQGALFEPLQKLLERAIEENWPLRTLITKLTSFIDNDEETENPAIATETAEEDLPESHENAGALRTYGPAIAVALLGVAIAAGIWFFVR